MRGAQNESMESDSGTKMNLSSILTVTPFNPRYKALIKLQQPLVLGCFQINKMWQMYLRFTVKSQDVLQKHDIKVVRFKISWAI